MVSTNTQQRIQLVLDRRLPLEALVLNRLGKIPLPRQEDWMRGLVVTGFCAESQVLKAAKRDHAAPACAQTTGSNHPGQTRSAYAHGLSAGRFTHKQSAREHRVSPGVMPQASGVLPNNRQKPFAGLRNVIG